MTEIETTKNLSAALPANTLAIPYGPRYAYTRAELWAALHPQEAEAKGLHQHPKAEAEVAGERMNWVLVEDADDVAAIVWRRLEEYCLDAEWKTVVQ
jgi:hypothetical protein